MGGVKKGSGELFRFLIYLIIVILINVAGITLFFRIDLTSNNIYSISEASQGVVSTLSEPLTINVFFTKNLPAPHNNTERYLRDLLEEYAVYANRYFNFRFYDVSPELGEVTEEAGENQELARSFGISPVQIQAIEKDEVKFQRAYMGLVMIHGDIIERIPTLTSTDGLEYRITTAIQKLNNKVSALLNLKEKIQIKLIFSSSLNTIAPFMRLDKLPDLPKAIEDAVAKLNEKLYGKLEYSYLDPSKDPGLDALAQKHNIMNLTWPAIPQNHIEAGKGSIGLLIEYADKKAISVPLLQVIRIPIIGTNYNLIDMDDLDAMINENVESLIGINEDIGYLADHGTLSLYPTQEEDGAANFQALMSQTYSINDVNLKEGGIPAGLRSLIIAGPKEPFSEYELFQLDQFLMRGNNLILFLDQFNEIMQPNQPGMMQFNQGPVYVPINTGIEKLLDHYGVTVKKSYVMDENCYQQQVPSNMGGGVQPLYFAPIIQNESINKDLDFLKNIKGFITIRISPLEINAERIKENGLQAHELFSSSKKSWEMTGRINLNPMMNRPPHPEEQQSLPLAYVLEGGFPSYFAGKPIPEKKAEEEGTEKPDETKTDNESDGVLSKIEGQGEIITTGRPAKILLIGSSAILKDNIIDAQGQRINSSLVMNMLDYMNNRESIAVMRGKEQLFNPLADIGAAAKTFVKSFNIIGLPILVVLFGLLVWFLRHSRKKRIQAMFQK
ncbi:MAG: Gldg family protein [Deltaproteobacteria bacterium]|nr:Gldg family protein [Deltaproteobacteria bacterium]